MRQRFTATYLVPSTQYFVAGEFPCLQLIVFGAILLGWLSFVHAQESADLILRGGKVITLVDSPPEADAIAIRGDRIVDVGSAADVQPLIAAKTRVIELAGRTAMPGFIEGHGHFFSLGDSKRKLDLSRAASWDEIIALVAAEAKKRRPANGSSAAAGIKANGARGQRPMSKAIPRTKR